MTVLVGTTLRRILDTKLAMTRTFRRGSGLHPLGRHMDKWGVAECQEKRQYIIDTIVANTDMLKTAIRNAKEAHEAIGMNGSELTQSHLVAGAGWFLDAAIGASVMASEKRTARPQREGRAPAVRINRSSNRKKYAKSKAIVMREEAIHEWKEGMAVATPEQQEHRIKICRSCPVNIDGVCAAEVGGCGFPVDKKVIPAESFCPSWRWAPQKAAYRPLVNPTRHFNFHIYPKIGAEWNWHWHIEQIRRVNHLFNGRVVIGIVHGKGLARPEEVKRLLEGVRVTDWLIMENSNLAETATMPGMLECVKTDDPNAITFRGHTKGVTHARNGIEQGWARLMWASCMDLESVEDALASHIMAGPMKCHEQLVSTKENIQWFYAGTFFWFRNKEIFERDWSTMGTTRWWVEAWPSAVCSNEDAASICQDFIDRKFCNAAYWDAVVGPSFEVWKSARPDRMKDLE